MTQPADTLTARFYPEAAFGGFTRDDASIEFYTRIAALIRPTDRVLDYGAGRGAQIDTETAPHRRWLKTLKGRVAHLEGCDVDRVVMDNPYLDHAALFDPAAPLPYGDASFDLVYSNWVFEHVEDPASVAAELLRVTRPGGVICAMTPNKWGYIAMAARLAGNANHVPLLRRIQPGRLEFDVFPTRYRLNSVGDIARAFGRGADVVTYRVTSDPAYHFNRAAIYGAFKVINRLLPNVFAPVLLSFIRKHGDRL